MIALATLVAALESGSPAEKLDAAEQLARLENGARGAAVALVEACATEQDALRDWVVAALEGLGPPEPGDVARLAALLDCEALDVAFWAATLLGRLEADAASAVPALGTALQSHPDLVVRQRAAWALGKIGPAAVPARAALEQAAASDDARLSRLAGEALKAL